MICLFGGTFDPVHRGHIHGGQMVCDLLALSEIRFVLSGRPSHRAIPQTTIEQRWEMLQLACSIDDRLIPDDTEICHDEVSYTVDTLGTVRKTYPMDVVAWVMGSDAFAELSSWRSWRDILKLANLVVLERPGENRQLSKEMQQIAENCRIDHKPERAAGQVMFLEVEMLAVSASEIRSRRRSGKAVDHLLPGRVNTYIDERGLYGGTSTSDP